MLVGDFVYSRAFQMMVGVDNMRVLQVLADATNVIAEGEKWADAETTATRKTAVEKYVKRFGTRWPNLLKLVLEHRTVLLGWNTVRPLAVMLTLIVLNTVACQLIWPSAGNFRATQLMERPILTSLSLLAGAVMLAFDMYTLFTVGKIDEKAVEKHFDLAESWLRGLDKGGMETAVLYPTLGLCMSFLRDRDWAVALLVTV